MILKNLYITGEAAEAKDIKIESGIISEINPSYNKDDFKDETIIEFENCIAFPGLINSHDHLEFNLYQQLGHKVYEDYVEWGNDIHLKDKNVIDSIESIPPELRIKYGLIKNLLCGVTSVAHHGSSISLPPDSPINVITKFTCIHSVRLGGKWKLKLNFLKNSEPYVIHVGEGLNSESSEEINELIRWNLFSKKIIGIHGIAMTEDQSKYFSALIWCPVSNFFLFNQTAKIEILKKSTKILFGTDSTLTAGWNIWDHLRQARETGLLNDRELFSSVTDTAACVWGINDIGKISIGYKADVVIARNKCENSFESFFQTTPEDIILILKKGKVILYDEALKNTLPISIKQSADFKQLNVNGKSKYIGYPVNSILDQIKKYNPSLKFPEDAKAHSVSI